jgi:sugar phosphate isomerase/epimerase
MSRTFSLAYLTSHTCTPPQALQLAAATGYAQVGLRLWPNEPGAPQQFLIHHPAALAETLAVQKDTGVGVFDIEIIRIGADFNPALYRPLLDVAAALQARAVLVAADDSDAARLSDSYARLCEWLRPYGLTADLEFMPWTAVKTAPDALRVVTSAGNPSNAGILVDALHVGRSHTTVQDVQAMPRHLLHYAQICDAQAGTGFSTEQLIHTARCERLQPGEGNIDLPALFAALPMDLPISVEVVHRARMAGMSASAWAAQCLAASQSLFLAS